MNYHDQAKAELEIARTSDFDAESADYFVRRSIALSLLALTERLDSIDDALRNTIGGNPR